MTDTMDYGRHSPFNFREGEYLQNITWHNVESYGAVADTTTDCTAAIQKAIDAAQPGETIYFPATGSGSYYRINGTLNITKPNLRFLGQPRDGYAVSLRCFTASATMLVVKASSFVFENMALMGDITATNGVGATVTGIDLYGDTDGNIDAKIIGSTLQWLSVGVRVRARNSTVENCLFSNCLDGVVWEGNAAYHTGPNANQNRGNVVRQTRFHNIGSATTNACVKITTTSLLLHAKISDCYHDSNGVGKFLIATGTVANPIKSLTVTDIKHTESVSDQYDLTYVNNSKLSDIHINGVAGAGGSVGRALVMNNCDSTHVNNLIGVQLGGAGVYARNNIRCHFDDIKFRAIGGHGFDVDSTNTLMEFSGLKVETATGWGFIGSPTGKFSDDYSFKSCSSGTLSSTTFFIPSVYIGAADMIAITGTPTIAGVTGVGYPPAWLLDAASVEQVTGSIGEIPNTWETFNVFLLWAPTDGAAGNVVFDMNYSYLIDGQLTSYQNAGFPSPAQATSLQAGKVKRFAIALNQTVQAGPVVIRVDRNGPAAGDTYAADVSLIGVQLVKAS